MIREVPMSATKTTKGAAAEMPARETPVVSPGSTTAESIEDTSRDGLSAVAAEAAPALTSEDAVQRIGSKYLADLVRELDAELEKRFRTHLSTKNQRLRELKERMTTAERQHKDLQERLHGLEKELKERALELDHLLGQHREDLNTLGSAVARLWVTVERSKGRVGLQSEDASPSADAPTNPDRASLG
jgi:chromosome segregation ATPase